MTTGERTGHEVTHLGPYRLLHRLGEGGMGVVHLGLDRAGRAVAVKVLRAHVAHDPDARARLAREVSTLRRVRHPMIAEVLDADVDGNQPYVVTRFVNGPGLDEVVRDQGALAPSQLTVLGRGLSSALEAIHAAGVVHRDLKPGNVLVLDGEPVVIDFGIAHVADDVRLTSVGLVMGTPGYLSPEVVDGEQVTAATDWWGWAATLAFAASGRPPFGRGPMDVVIDRVRRGECDLDDVDRRLRPLLAAALAVRPEDRPVAAEVLDALERYAAGEDATVTIASAPPYRAAGGPTTVASPAVPPTAVHLVPAAEQYWPVDQLLGERDDPPEDHEPKGRPGAPAEPAPAAGPRPRRTGTLLALLAALVGCAVAYPVVTAAAAAVLMLVARTIDRSASAIARRRYERGARRSDPVVAALSSPWHLLTALLVTALALVLPALLGAATVFLAGLVVTRTDGAPSPGSLPAVGAGAVVALLAAWWGPGGGSLRRGTRVAVRAVVPRQAAPVVVLLLLAVAAGAGLLAVSATHPQWWPVQSLPFGIALP